MDSIESGVNCLPRGWTSSQCHVLLPIKLSGRGTHLFDVGLLASLPGTYDGSLVLVTSPPDHTQTPTRPLGLCERS